ncbi:MAG TPA: citrate synthase [Acidimicrobiales bacterium]|nr:citrate synthase [Acidimicrobiales bacterium]
MINRRLTAAEAADLLGVKPATLYAYVSRGLLPREKGAQGSSFDPRDVALLARSGRTRPDGPTAEPDRVVHRGGRAPGAQTTEPLFVTELTLIDGGHLFYRGLDAVQLSRTRSFEEVAGWLWGGDWPDPGEVWSASPTAADAVDAALKAVPSGARPLERFMLAVLVAGLSDDLRHDLTGASVPVIGKSIISLFAWTLEQGRRGRGGTGDEPNGGSIADRVWRALSPLPPTPQRVSVLDAALVLSADHELAPSTMAARVAASFRADPYAVVSTGLGPASGSWAAGSTGAPSEVELMLEDCLAMGVERAVGERLRRTGSVPHGFGMPLYQEGDPRGGELLVRLDEVGGSSERHDVVRKVVDLAEERGFPPANVDLGLGALSFCAEMPGESGQAVATLAKVAGWLAHALEEYANPSRFRSRAYYVGQRPG